MTGSKVQKDQNIMSGDGGIESHPHGNLPGTASLIAELDRKQVGPGSSETVQSRLQVTATE